MAVPRWLTRILDHYHVAYEDLPRPPAPVGPPRPEGAEYRVAQTVLLAADGRPVSVVLPAGVGLDLGRVQAVLGSRELRLASEAEVAGGFKGTHPLAVPPLRLRHDQCVLMDRSLAHVGKMLFAAGTPQAALAVRFRDWYRAVRPGVGRFTAAAGRAGGAAPTVLIVEDEADTNALLCRLLEREGFLCRGAEEGRQALALASSMHPAAILLDLMLPDIPGFEVYEQLRRTGSIRSVPVIIVTALDDEAARRRGSQLGADAYLTKPFQPQDLVSELRGVLADAGA